MGKKLVAFAVVMALALGMAACREKTTSEKASDAAKSAGQDVKEAAQDVGKAAQDTARDAKDAVEDATK